MGIMTSVSEERIPYKRNRKVLGNQLSSRIALQNVYPVNVPVKVKYEMKGVTLCCHIVLFEKFNKNIPSNFLLFSEKTI